MRHEKWNSGSTGGAGDYQPSEQDRVLLDYAQTAQRRADPWVEFELECGNPKKWVQCTQATNPVYAFACAIFRRKPHVVTLSYQGKGWELPLFYEAQHYFGGDKSAIMFFDDTKKRDQWLAALREIAGGENG